ncbi:MAG TPA: GGDEF domain-containing protein [Bryobacteraceae bacterium]|nr:GGDEF domain-containing protein [Bryobacteraceae bacterium]
MLDCYLAAIKNVAHYAIELDAEMVGPYRANVEAVAGDVQQGTAEALVESRSNLRALLRNYRDKASEYLNQLRAELANTANALQRILNTLSLSDGDHEVRLRQAIQSLRGIAGSPAAAAVQSALQSSIENLEQTLDQLRAQQQMTVSQFLLEISLLHKRIDALESAVSIDNLTKLFTRVEMEHRIRSADSCGSLLLIRVQGFRLAQARFEPAVALELAGAFTKRLRNCLLPNALIGRWSEEEFVVVVPTSREETMASAKLVAAQLSGSYVCLQGGKTVRPTLQIDVAALDLAPGQAEDTLVKIGQFLKG